MDHKSRLIITNMQGGFHALMQYTDYFDYSGLRGAIMDNVNRSCYLLSWNIAARMPDMKTSDACKNISPVSGCRAFRIGRNLAQRRSDKRGVTASAFNAMAFNTQRQYILKVSLRRAGEMKSRH